jgi:hypothetical protein
VTGAAAPLFTAADPPAVPEASTWAMMLLGFAGLGWAGYGTVQVANFGSGLAT